MRNTITEQRREARKLNLEKFYTGEPCNHGHVAMRYASSGGCVDCLSVYNRKWQKTRRFLRDGSAKRKRAAIRKGRDRALAFLGLPPSMTRAKAITAGVATYYTGKTCKGCGDMTARYTSTGGCIVCRSRISRDYHAKDSS